MKIMVYNFYGNWFLKLILKVFVNFVFFFFVLIGLLLCVEIIILVEDVFFYC